MTNWATAVAAVLIVGVVIAKFRGDWLRLHRGGYLGYAFTFTVASLIFVIAGTVGYDVSRPFAGGDKWTVAPIYSEILIGSLSAIMAAAFWYKALQARKS